MPSRASTGGQKDQHTAYFTTKVEFGPLSRDTFFLRRIAMEMAGLGKLSPNMMLIGFQEKWWACPDDADEYVRTIQSALDLHLSVGVFRIQSGFDLTSIGIMNQNVMRQFDDKLIFVVCFWV